MRLLYSVLVVSLLFVTSVEAASIKAVKGKKVLISLDGSTLKVGDTFSVVSSSGKITGAVKVSAVKGKTAEAQLKGKAAKGDELKSRNKAARKKKSSRVAEEPAQPPRESRLGVMLGYNSTSADVTITSGGNDTTVSLSGSGFSAKGFYDYNLISMFWFRGLAGLEQFVVGGENNGECGGECTAEINYITADLWGRMVFGGFWFGGGFSLLLPMSKDTTAFDEGSISTTSLISAGLGFDIPMGNGILPIQLEYNMYPSTEKVEASAITVRAGISF